MDVIDAVWVSFLGEVFTMDLKDAQYIQNIALSAIRAFHGLLPMLENYDEKTKEELRKGIGIVIGNIDVRILKSVYEKYPELDDIA